MSSVRLGLIFLGVLVIALVAATPLSIGLAWAGLDRTLSAREVSGSLWNGRMTGVSIGTTRLGDVRAGLSATGFLKGRPAVEIATRGGTASARGRLLFGRRVGVEALNGAAPLSLAGVAPPIDGTLNLTSFNAFFAGNACLLASGSAAAQVSGLLSGPLALSGQPRCVGDALVLDLSGQRDGVGVVVSMELRADGRYRTTTRVTTTDRAVMEALRAAGFEDSPNGFVRLSNGQLS